MMGDFQTSRAYLCARHKVNNRDTVMRELGFDVTSRAITYIGTSFVPITTPLSWKGIGHGQWEPTIRME